MSTTENLLADFLTQDEAAAELEVCERTSEGIILCKIQVDLLPLTVPRGAVTVAKSNSRGRASTPENLLADFLTQNEAAAELKVCRRTLDRWRKLDEGPPITKLGRRILYRRSSVQSWLTQREHRGNGDDGASARREKVRQANNTRAVLSTDLRDLDTFKDYLRSAQPRLIITNTKMMDAHLA